MAAAAYPAVYAGRVSVAPARPLAGLLPAAVLPPVAGAANWPTVVSMAALGLGTVLRVVARAGGWRPP